MNANKLAINKIVRLGPLFVLLMLLLFLGWFYFCHSVCGNYAGKKNHTLQKFE